MKNFNYLGFIVKFTFLDYKKKINTLKKKKQQEKVAHNESSDLLDLCD